VKLPAKFRRVADEPVREPLAYEAEVIRRAVWLGQFGVHYQPIIDLTTGELAGMEALVRWEHPDRGVVPARRFVGVAEREGLILPIGNDAMRAASAFRRSLRIARSADIRISLNLSAPELMNTHLVETLERILQQTGLRADLVEVEISERTLLQTREIAPRVLQQLREMGISISIDDFGTLPGNHSSLHKLPVNAVKVDVRLEQDRGEHALENAVQQARTWGLDVSAKRVETVDHFTTLRALGITRAQGYVLGRPIPAHEFESLIVGNIALEDDVDSDDEPAVDRQPADSYSAPDAIAPLRSAGDQGEDV
jgi:EAL domain-containing protein (putative c-di-GMP-specific phosphodiesterase class I)